LREVVNGCRMVGTNRKTVHPMSHPVKLADELLLQARRAASLNSRSVPKQIEYWSRIGKIAEENPDLPYGFIREVLISKQEAEDGELSEFGFG
jgi:ParD-like antitoxin of type II bacterial toxin-antitoxin system